MGCPPEITFASGDDFFSAPCIATSPLPYTYRDRSMTRERRVQSLAASVCCIHDDPYHGDAGTGLVGLNVYSLSRHNKTAEEVKKSRENTQEVIKKSETGIEGQMRKEKAESNRFPLYLPK